MCDLNTDRTDEEGRRRREGGPGIKWPKEGERRGEGDKLPIKWVSGIWDAIAYRVRALISDLIAHALRHWRHQTFDSHSPTAEIMLKD